MSFSRHRIRVAITKAFMRFAMRVQALPGAMTPPPFRLMQIGSAYWQSRALAVAASLDLATLLGDETLEIDVLAHKAGTDADALHRLLRFLAALGIFSQVGSTGFKNSRLSRPLRQDVPDSVRSMILLHNHAAMSQPWIDALETGVREGRSPFSLVHGKTLFEFLDATPALESLFASAMDSVEALLGDSLVTDFAWERFRRVIDVGGSKGSKSSAILRHFPALRALVVDRPHVLAQISPQTKERCWQEFGERLSWESGDMLQRLPSAEGPTDLYFLSAVLHGISDAQACQTLSCVATAIGNSGARVAVAEMLMPEVGADEAVCAFDMQMFVNSQGKERTLPQWQALFDKAGLTLEEIVPLRTLGAVFVLQRQSLP